MNKLEIDMIIGMIQSLINMIEMYNPDLAKNPVIAELEKAIEAIKALGL